jgi:hypothetical protein
MTGFALKTLSHSDSRSRTTKSTEQHGMENETEKKAKHSTKALLELVTAFRVQGGLLVTALLLSGSPLCLRASAARLMVIREEL